MRKIRMQMAMPLAVVPLLLLGFLCPELRAEPEGDEKVLGRRLAQQATKAPGG